MEFMLLTNKGRSVSEDGVMMLTSFQKLKKKTEVGGEGLMSEVTPGDTRLDSSMYTITPKFMNEIGKINHSITQQRQRVASDCFESMRFLEQLCEENAQKFSLIEEEVNSSDQIIPTIDRPCFSIRYTNSERESTARMQSVPEENNSQKDLRFFGTESLDRFERDNNSPMIKQKCPGPKLSKFQSKIVNHNLQKGTKLQSTAAKCSS